MSKWGGGALFHFSYHVLDCYFLITKGGFLYFFQLAKVDDTARTVVIFVQTAPMMNLVFPSLVHALVWQAVGAPIARTVSTYTTCRILLQKV